MTNISKTDYSALDQPQITMFLFHPRSEQGMSALGDNVQDVLIPVEQDAAIGARFHMTDKSAPNILFFHGNGEIVADYDELGQLYNQMDINFLAADYRGYGRSTGNPSVTAMMNDCHVIFEFVRKWLEENTYTGPLVVMGRSLGSASVLELVFHYKDMINGLIVESGFAYTSPLLQLLGVNVHTIGFNEEQGCRNLDKIRSFDKPVLVIHAERDHIIPFSDGQALYDTCKSSDKTLLKIPGANHNDIFYRGIEEYLTAVKTLLNKL
ncbi:MAG: alpha/beta hydrolase [Desulfobacterales bacterium]|nr:alpha/beta hydrolase [Desulfobacterales bacterium]